MSGEAKISSSLADKEKILATSELVKSIYQTTDNPIFEVFYHYEVSAIKLYIDFVTYQAARPLM